MDCVLRSLEKKINYYRSANKIRDLTEIYRVKIEYGLVFLLAYLWGKNFDSLDSDDKEFVFNKIRKPTIGTVLEVARKLDTNKIVFNKKVSEILNKYPTIRNEGGITDLV